MKANLTTIINMVKIILLCISFTYLSANGQNKIALVIGNSNYEDSPLRNPVNDATDLASVLSQLGFHVTLETNLNHQQMELVIRSFGTQINSGDVALFYFSGHGTQVDGLNYLVPVGVNIIAANEVKYKSVEAGFVLDKMESAGSNINIVILDACRNNPFKGFRSSSRGFAYMSAPTGSIISYATAPGSVALDGEGRNSPYTKYLIQAIQLENLQIEDIFKKVREYVAQDTDNKQIPWESSSLIGDFYFKKGDGLIETDVKLETSNNYYSPNNNSNNINQSSTSNNNNNIHNEDNLINSGVFIDSRNDRKYRWIRIGSQIWMAENLNYRTTNTWCYENSETNCNKYGRLYNWEDARKSCPTGWHLPSDEDWIELEGTVDDKYEPYSSEWRKYSGRGYDAGEKLKSVDGFSAIMSGARTLWFQYLNKAAWYWTATSNSNREAVCRYIWKKEYDINRWIHSKKMGFSVRCIKD